jgi:hypothetical protein
LAAKGADISIISRNEEKLRQAQAEIEVLLQITIKNNFEKSLERKKEPWSKDRLLFSRCIRL